VASSEATWSEATAKAGAIEADVGPLLWTLGQRLKVLRSEARLSQLELATAAGMRKQFLNRVESGRQNVSTKTLWRLAVALGIPMSSLFENLTRTEDLR
jgi:transcriptional regulator with XRE-family HTH domain